MKKPNEQTAVIDSLSHDGRGIARINGKTVFIDGAMAEETVRFRYLKRHRRFDEGVVIDVVNAAPQRTPARCQHFGHCGGCNLQHMPSEQQLSHKQSVFLEQLQHIAATQPEHLLPPLTGPQWGYRHKARLGVRYVEKKASVLVGFREKNGRYVAELNDCAILAPNAAKLIQPLRELIQQLHARQQIAQLEVAVGETTVALIVRHLVELDDHDQQAWLQFAKQHGCHIYWQPGGPDTITRFWPTTGPERLNYQLPNHDLNFQFYPTDFTQVNPELNQNMVDQSLQLLAPSAEDTILDLFCGLGNFSLALARYAKHVTGVEGSQAMVDRGYENANLNQINNVEFYCADLSKPPTDQTWTQRLYDKVLLDPPRTGAQAIVHNIDRFMPQKILYVSCNTATLARDTQILVQEKGYHLETAGIMDMFPQTSHVEAMALFIHR